MLSIRAMDEREICLLYEQSLSRDFPASELKSLSAILGLYRRGMYDVLGAVWNDAVVAYALIYRPKDDRVVLLDYLAVEPDFRKQGLGTQLLDLLRAHYAPIADIIMIECERPKAAPDEAGARKRIHFYTHAGAILTSVRIWLFGVEYSILYMPCGKQLPEWDWAQKMLAMYRQMLPQDLFISNVRLLRS
ncbi:MAG: GNAT family N-acetyltransferase [Clostridiales bacterium]|nr:GNAT family N-acetyltransferase [Clostridiales bacterium]